MPEIGFGVSGGAVGLPTAEGVPGAPDHGYMGGDFEIGASQTAGPGFVSAVARVGPAFEIRPGDPAPPVISVNGLAELTAGIEIAKTFHVTLGVTFLVGHDGGAVSEDSLGGSPYAGVVGNIGFVARPSGK